MSTLEDLEWWGSGMAALREREARDGDAARERARTYGNVYADRRAPMVFDVVASRQRRYVSVVLPKVKRFEATPQAASLQSLAEQGPGNDHGLRTGETQTMQGVARGLLTYCRVKGLDHEAGVKEWAEAASPFEHAPKLEPYVGSVSGMGPALFAYLRMRCGADAIKPDLRVRDALNGLGFNVPNDPHAILIVASAAAAELGITRLALDQLLWWAVDEG